MKVVIYANVDIDWKERIRTPYGITQFRSYISRSFITADLPYTHPSAKAVQGDIIVWAFKEGGTEGTWSLLGDGFVCDKWKGKGGSWSFGIDGARLYPRSVSLDELKFGNSLKKSLNVGGTLTWKQYRDLIKKAGEPLVT